MSMYVFEGVIALRTSARYDGREAAAARECSTAHSQRASFLLEALESVARAELDLRNQHIMELRSKATGNGPQASHALGILLFLTFKPSHSATVQSPHLLQG